MANRILVFGLLICLFSCKNHEQKQEKLLEKLQADGLNSGVIVTDIVSDFKLRMTEGEYHETAKRLTTADKFYIMKITGHKTERLLFEYARVSGEMAALEMARVMDKLL